MRRLRVGIVGCGEVTQIMHLPSLRLLGERFEVVALCDASPAVARGVAARWGIEVATSDWEQLVAAGGLDAVLVAAPHPLHAPVTVAALEAGLHVLVEKPMSLTLREADAIAEAQARCDRVVQVGYMRRYAPAFAAACQAVAEMDGIRLARVHDVLGDNELIADQAADVIRPTDLDPADAEALADAQAGLLSESVGADPRARHSLQFLMTLNSHDLSAMRELLGLPRGILYAARREGPATPYFTAAFDYGGFVCHLETGFDRLPRADQHIRVFGDDRVVEVRWNTGYVRNLPVEVTVTDAVAGGGTRTGTLQPDWSDPFVHEWIAFHESVTTGAPVKADPADARLDLELALDLVQSLALPSPTK